VIAALLDSGAMFDLFVALPLVIVAVVGVVLWAGRQAP
jgi:hypothetical protein